MNRGPKIVEGFSEGGKSRSLTLNYHDYRKCHVDIRMLQIRQTEKLGVTNSVVCLKISVAFGSLSIWRESELSVFSVRSDSG